MSSEIQCRRKVMVQSQIGSEEQKQRGQTKPNTAVISVTTKHPSFLLLLALTIHPHGKSASSSARRAWRPPRRSVGH